MTADARLPALAGLYPSVTLGDGQWDHVVRVLRDRKTLVHTALASRIDAQVQECRRQNLECMERDA